MPKVKLTQSSVESATPPAKTRKVDYFDTSVTGLMLEVRQTGKTYYLRFQNLRGQTQQKKLGDASILKLSDARKMAVEKLRLIALGEDPFAAKKLLRDVPTVEQFVHDSYLPYIKGYKRSWRTDECLLRNHILPAIGRLHLDEVTRRHMVDLFSRNRADHKPGSTNRLIVLSRYIFNCALKWETAGVTKNPTAGIDLYTENNKRERYLSDDEAEALFIELDRSRNKQLKYIIAMLLLTGARKSEVLKARWNDFDTERRIWTVEFNKTGKTRYIPISDGLLTLLSQLPRFEKCDWIIPNPETLKPYKDIYTPWNNARTAAGLPDLRIHDLRHSFASYLINSGRSLYEVQKILGHTQVKTTQRYAHLSQDSLIAAANTAGASVPLIHQMPKDTSELTILSAR